VSGGELLHLVSELIRLLVGLATGLLCLGKVLLERGDPLVAVGNVPSAGVAGLDSFGELLGQHRLFAG
jgi:hypothetical protein